MSVGLIRESLFLESLFHEYPCDITNEIAPRKLINRHSIDVYLCKYGIPSTEYPAHYRIL